MTTYVVDNGEDYSAHRIFFVETSASKEQVDTLLRLIHDDGRMYVAASLDAAPVWYAPRKSVSLAGLAVVLGDYWYGEDNHRPIVALLAEIGDPLPIP